MQSNMKMPGAVPAVVAKQLSDLLLAFPAAATEGIQWTTLVRKYEERHRACLDITSLGHTSVLAAASTLLWDVAKVVDCEETDNPIVSIEDSIALIAQPGLWGCWPSLYQSLCEIVISQGTSQLCPQEGSSKPAVGVLLSQLKPMLERHWHANFDENTGGFLNGSGTFIRFKKMKHLLHAVVRWRAERLAWRRADKSIPSAIDAAISMCLELRPSKKHNDLILCCCNDLSTLGAASGHESVFQSSRAHALAKAPLIANSHPIKTLCDPYVRAERMALHSSDGKISQPQSVAGAALPSSLSMPHPLSFRTGQEAESFSTFNLDPDLFDDPFEPPPEACKWPHQQEALWMSVASHSTTTVGSDCSSECGCRTPVSSWGSGFDTNYDVQSAAHSGRDSGTMTPVPLAAVPACAFVPMWFQLMQPSVSAFRDVCVIPSGIVQNIRANFEPPQLQ